MTDNAQARKPRKRASGEGSLRFNEKRKLWVGRLMVGRRLDGKPDVREVTAKTQRACRERLDALKLQAANGSLSSSEAAGLTVAAFLDRWLSMVQDSRRVATYLRYRAYSEGHFKPALGQKRLAKLTHDDVQQFLTAKRTENRSRGSVSKPLSPRSLHNIFVALGTALSWGVRKGYIAISPMARVDPPRFVRTEVRPLTAEQTMKMIEGSENDPLVCLWTLAALTGARKGELLALSWDDVDLDAGQVHIRRSLRTVKAGEPEYTEPKTARSRRTLDLAEDAIRALRAHRDRQQFYANGMWEGWNPHRLVFVTKLGTPFQTDNVTRSFKAALARAGLPSTTRFHDLRHGAATLMLEAGESVPTVAEYLGHATPVVTLSIYAHAVPGSKKRAAERLGATFRAAGSPEAASDDQDAAASS